ITSFSPFGVLSDPTLLPVELLYFKGIYKDGYTELTWETLSETNNDYFTIEESRDGKNFEEVASVEGAGNSSKKISYSYTDTRNLSGQIYYRLRQTDYNGSSTMSPIVSVIIPAKSIGSVPYPNPTLNSINIPVSSEEFSVVISVYNVSGDAVFSSEVTSTYNEYATIDMSELQSGGYLVEVQYADQREYFRVFTL